MGRCRGQTSQQRTPHIANTAAGTAFGPTGDHTKPSPTFMGATYTILKLCRLMVPSSSMWRPSSCRMVSIATLVLPAPVGAHSRMLSAPNRAVLQTCKDQGVL